jgi:uncharacterized protein (TIGR03086 family)
MPSDELESAEATYAVLDAVLQGITAADLDRRTPCREFDVAGLTDHLMNSIAGLGGAAGARFPERDRALPVREQIDAAARPALDAWRQRGLAGVVSLGGNDVPAQLVAGILSLEFLVHAWDYAAATGRECAASEPLADYVAGLARTIITPQGRATAGFDEPVDVPDGASAMRRLLAYTGRTG